MKDLMKKIVYGALNVLTLGKGIGRLINGVRIIFPVRYFRFFEADYEKDNFETFKQHLKEGDVIIDIGAQFDVLRGAGETIRKYQPKMILALHPKAIAANGNSLAQIYDILTDYHYLVTWENRYLTKEDFCVRHDLFDVYLSYAGENTNA